MVSSIEYCVLREEIELEKKEDRKIEKAYINLINKNMIYLEKCYKWGENGYKYID
jgi:hypothetical protein